MLGYQELPEQTSPEQFKEESGEKMSEKLKHFTSQLEEYDIDVESEVNYTPDISKSLDRYIQEQHSHVLLIPGEIDSLKRLLVPIYNPDQINKRMATILRNLAYSSRLPITIVIIETENNNMDAETIRRLATEQLTMAGLKENQLRITKVEIPSLVKVVSQIAGDEDLLVLIESESDEKKTFFKSSTDKIQNAVNCPTLIVFRETGETEATESVSAKEMEEPARTISGEDEDHGST